MDFFGIGAPKCATTWLARCLSEHPEITLSRDKEPNFFARTMEPVEGSLNPGYLRDWAAYAAQWPDDDSTVHGEFSVNVMHNVDTAPQAIGRYYPDARFIVMLRQPVARTYSHYFHLRRHEFIDRALVPDSFEEAIERTSLVERSKYARQLRPWFERFGRGRIHVILDLDVASQPKQVVRDAYAFLGVDSAFRPTVLHQRINVNVRRPGYKRKAVVLARRLRRAHLGWVVAMAKKAGGERIVSRLSRGKPATYPPMRPETRRRLMSAFEPDIKELEELLGKDLSAWRSEPG